MRSLNALDLAYCDKISELLGELNTNVNLKIIQTPISSKKRSAVENIHDLQSDPIDYDIGLRLYQERIQEQYTLTRSETKIIDKYINQGVIPPEAKVMAHFSVLAEVELVKAEIYEDLFENTDDMLRLCNFKVDNEGHVIELYLHFTEGIYLALIPKMLCSLNHLEEICFPNNIIKKIPEWIAGLKSLRALDVSNGDQADPDIPESIKSYIESLERFNEIYS